MGQPGGLIHITTPAGRLNCGTEEQRERILAQLLSGDLISCSAISEPNIVSSAPRSVETTAVLDGDKYVINGTKTWTTNGTIADIVNVICVTDKSKGPLAISTIMVEKSVSPFGVREIHKLGLRACPLAELSFSDCRVPKRIYIDPVLPRVVR